MHSRVVKSDKLFSLADVSSESIQYRSKHDCDSFTLGFTTSENAVVCLCDDADGRSVEAIMN